SPTAISSMNAGSWGLHSLRGSPLPNDGVTEIEARVVAALDGAGVPYELIACDPHFADTAAFCERYGYPPSRSANTIVVASKKEPRRHVACVVLATTRLDVNGVVRRRLGVSKASFASAEETAAITGMTIGGVTALALPDGLPRGEAERRSGAGEPVSRRCSTTSRRTGTPAWWAAAAPS